MTAKKLSLFLILAIVGSILIGALSIDWRKAFETDIFKLIDADSDEETQLAQSILKKDLSREIQLVVHGKGVGTNLEFQKKLLEEIEKLDAFKMAFTPQLASVSEALIGQVYQDRLMLLLPGYLARHAAVGDSKAVAKQAVEQLDAFLMEPESIAYEAQLTEDPLLLVPGLMDSLQTSKTRESTHNNVVSFNVQLALNPGSNVEAIVADIELLRNWVHAQNATWELLDTGYHRYASESKTRIKSEIFRLNVLTLGVTVVLIVLLLRKPLVVLPMVTIVGFSVAGAIVVSIGFFGRIHIISLVIGSILAGIAIDYGFHILLKREETQSDSFRETLKLIGVPLATSCISTVAGFLILLTNPIKAINEVGVFVASGLLIALVLSVLLALVLDAKGPVRFSRFIDHKLPVKIPRSSVWVVMALALAASVGFNFGSSYRDDVRDLQIPLRRAPQNEALISKLIQSPDNSSQWVTYSDTLIGLLDAQNELSLAMDTTPRFDLSVLFPNSAMIESFLEFRNHRGKTFPKDLEDALAGANYETAEFSVFLETMEQLWARNLQLSEWESIYRAYPGLLQYPLSLLMSGRSGRYWGVSQYAAEFADPQHFSNSFELAPLDSLNSIFKNYRSEVMRSLWVSFGIIAVLIGIVFRPVRALKILFIPCGSTALSLGAITLTGSDFTLFHLVGLLLGVCIVLDYAVFAVCKTNTAPPVSIRASAATTIASFLALASSQIPAVSNIGITVFLVVLFGWIMTEFKGALQG